MKRTAFRTNRSVVFFAVLLALGGCSSGDDDASGNSSVQDRPFDEDLDGQPSEPAESGGDGGADVDAVEGSSGAGEPTEQEPPDERPTGEPTEEESPAEPPDETPSGTADESPEEEPAETGEPAAEPSDAGSRLPSSASERLATLFAVANGEVFEPVLAILERLGTRDTDAERTPISSAPDPDFPRAGPREVFPCPDGGTFAVAVGAVSGAGPFSSTVAEGCAIGELTVDGTFYEDLTINRTGGPSSRGLSVRDYRLVDAATGATTTMNGGEVGLREPAAQDGGDFVPVRWIARELAVSGGGESYSATSQVTIRPESISPDATVTFGLEVTIEGLNGGGHTDARLETVTPLRPAEAGAERFASGAVRVVDGDGRVETLDADGGDPEAFSLTLEKDGTTTSYAVPWSEVEGFGRPEPDDVSLP